MWCYKVYHEYLFSVEEQTKKSLNHGIFWVGTLSVIYSTPPPPKWAETPSTRINFWGLMQPDLECFQDWGIYHLSGQTRQLNCVLCDEHHLYRNWKGKNIARGPEMVKWISYWISTGCWKPEDEVLYWFKIFMFKKAKL